MAGKGVTIDLTGCELAVISARVPYLPVGGGVGVTGRPAGSSRRKGGGGSGGMAVVKGLIVGREIGRALSGKYCMGRVASEAENHVVLIFWACEEYSSMLVV